jgi:hypothetical protein
MLFATRPFKASQQQTLWQHRRRRRVFLSVGRRNHRDDGVRVN